MSIFLNLIIFILGLIILSISSDFLIKSSVRLAHLLKFTVLFIGLVFIAFGTSLPEATVSLVAIIKKHKDIALGNIVGSNIANIGLVLGFSGLIRPLRVDNSLLRKEVSIMILSTLLLYIFSLDGFLSRLEGLIFILVFCLFFIFTCKSSKLSKDKEIDSQKFKVSGFFSKINSKLIIFFSFLLSLVFLLASANMMVNSGVNIARFFKISPWIIAITVFGVGTSLPELAVSISASVEKVSSLSVGNVIGSNVFNILVVLGLASLIRPITLDKSILNFELPILIIFSIIVPLFVKTGFSRFKSFILFLGYTLFLITYFK
ncbi:MAG: calcium/sodium antiporter [Candidatus Omnitrophica bacterium]|nr:calcium/sodium antiporter [Candidatus Omnitrophota bacterium]